MVLLYLNFELSFDWCAYGPHLGKVPVCDCDLERKECSDCNNGFMSVVLAGKEPKWKEIVEDDTPGGSTSQAAPGNVNLCSTLHRIIKKKVRG